MNLSHGVLITPRPSLKRLLDHYYVNHAYFYKGNKEHDKWLNKFDFNEDTKLAYHFNT